jgi:hypothetical protein
MNNLTTYQSNLLDNIQDLSKFVLVGREKLVSVRAEIRAIDKLHLAEEVRIQKREEAQMLSEALLDAEVRIGELLKQIPKADKGNQYTGKMVTDTDVHNQWQKDTAVQSLKNCDVDNLGFKKPKLEVVQELGFSEKQKQRFESLAANKDIVEQVKAEARENEDIPTRSRVLQLVKEKHKSQKVKPSPDFTYHAVRAIHDAIGSVSTVQVDAQRLTLWMKSLKEDDKEFQLLMIDDGLNNLRTIKAFLTDTKNRKQKIR